MSSRREFRAEIADRDSQAYEGTSRRASGDLCRNYPARIAERKSCRSRRTTAHGRRRTYVRRAAFEEQRRDARFYPARDILTRPTVQSSRSPRDTASATMRVAKACRSVPSSSAKTSEMLKSFTFWRAFLCMAFITAVGNSVISFARDLVISVGAVESLAITLVGVLAVCNGLGRVLTGAVYDVLGRKLTMISANIITIVAAGVTLVAVTTGSLSICIIGLCLTGISYGSCPTVTSAFSASFYGQKYFSMNYSIINFNLIFASFIANFCNSLLIKSGSYVSPFVMLLVLAIIALALNFSIKKP